MDPPASARARISDSDNAKANKVDGKTENKGMENEAAKKPKPWKKKPWHKEEQLKKQPKVPAWKTEGPPKKTLHKEKPLSEMVDLRKGEEKAAALWKKEDPKKTLHKQEQPKKLWQKKVDPWKGDPKAPAWKTEGSREVVLELRAVEGDVKYGDGLEETSPPTKKPKPKKKKKKKKPKS